MICFLCAELSKSSVAISHSLQYPSLLQWEIPMFENYNMKLNKLQARGLHGPVFSGTGLAHKGCNFGPALSKIKNFGPGLAWPIFFLSAFSPDHLSDFKTNPFSCLHIINEFFCWWYIFLQFIKTTDLELTDFCYIS